MFRYQLENFSKLHNATVIFAVFVLYFLSGYLGLMFAQPTTNVSVIWPASGIALAAVILFGHRVSLGVFFASFLLNSYVLFHIASDSTDLWKIVLASLATGIGAALQANIAGALIHYFSGNKTFSTPLNVLKFLCIVMLNSLINSNVGALAVTLSGITGWDLYPQTIWTWWVGDTVGIFVITPLIWAWTTSPPKNFSFHTILEALSLGFSILIVAYLISFKNYHFSYFFVPCLFWAALRFKLAGSSLAVFLIALIVVLETSHEIGPFVKTSLSESLLLSALFIIVISGSVLALVAELNKGTQKQEIWESNHRSMPSFLEHWKETIKRWRNKRKR